MPAAVLNLRPAAVKNMSDCLTKSRKNSSDPVKSLRLFIKKTEENIFLLW